jgi:tellurite resistance protein TerC
MHENEVPFINGGEPIEWAPEISIAVSLSVIVGTLVVTAVASLLASRHDTPEDLDRHTGPRDMPGHRHHHDG